MFEEATMSAITVTIISLCIIFAGTTLGSALVFFFKKSFSDKTSNVILGLASGIMISAAIFGLLLPSIEQGESIYDNLAVLPVVGGFILGGLFLTLIDQLVPHFHKHSGEEEGLQSKLSDQIKFFLAVTIHNIPEGLAVGFACGMALSTNDSALIFSALSLAIGITIQNFPEGAAVSIPLLEENVSKGKAFTYGALSGFVEPIFGLLGVFISTQLTVFLPWLLAFAAGAMFYVTIDELIPSSRKGNHSHYGLWSFMIGFCVMLVLELVL